MKSIDMVFDVTDATGIDEPVSVAATLHLPDDVEHHTHVDLLFVLHGGGYTRRYWHPPFGDDQSYSFARWFTDRGRTVLAVDNLGMGESSKPADESKLSRERIAAANADILGTVRSTMERGDYGMPKTVATIGIGHSMGGMLMITQAALHGGLDRVAILGWANHRTGEGADRRTSYHGSGYSGTPKALMRDFFYLDDVPQSIVEADEACGSLTPMCMLKDGYDPTITHDLSARISVPVLTAFGVHDITADPWIEPSFFRASNDVSLHVIDGMAHCHNIATTRADHWSRLDRWLRA